ncbi:MAG: substrate-binding domain-containing protein [Desulfovibrionaceae bacterium]|nr:substrate-binding domain-containing protein [Desulfovibrionaceae bacterium]
MIPLQTSLFRRAALAACLAVLAVLGAAAPCRGEGRLFAIVAKSESDANFVRVYTTARAEAMLNGDTVILVGGKGEAHFRIQDAEVRSVLKRRPDGLAISVLRSNYLAENSFVAVHKAGIPVVTFDSDFTGRAMGLRAGYIGTDNRTLGVLLALEARALRPEGGVVAILTGGLDDTNLNDRMRGVRAGLGIGEENSGWTLSRRSPLPCRDNYDQALDQLELLLDDPEVDVIISVGWWAQMAGDYEQRMARYKGVLDSGRKVLIFAGAIDRQVKLLEKGLNHVNIGLNFEEMGRQVYLALKTLADGESIPPMTYIPVRVFRAPSVDK